MTITALPVRLAPAYVGTVQLGALAARRLLNPARRARLLRRCSTNVDNLSAGRWDTLVTSALVVEAPMDLGYALLLLAVLGYTEYAYGAWWAAGAFAWGHVGASLLVYGGLRAVRAGQRTRSATDVGTSYGRNAVLGFLAASLPAGRWRTVACSALLALAVRPLATRRPDFTDAGHLTALLLGLGLGAGRERTLALR
ncbi:rhomboid-like protein [Streptomyces luteireticuli]|uniref:Rhomboid family intramembrane serine protease n=1 Tax=Streptomyces luteireticuli TaxID=173858 RepID=A0ABN0Z562_9ACTN